MTVTARLSSRFYQQFGDETTNELVEWFNAMDAHAQLQLRELSDRNAAKLSAELRAELQVRFAEQDARIERRFADVEIKFSRQIAELETKVTGQIAELRTEFRTDIARVESRLSWQMTGTFVTIVGVMVSIGTQFLHH